jgi:drug/metabolite transporter (DMT)-like permease
VAVVFALVSSLVFGCSDFIGGVTSRVAAPLWVAALGQMFSVGFVLPVALIASSERVTGVDVGWSLASGLAAAVGLGLFYSAMGRGLISLVVPVTAVVGATLPVAYGLVRGERPGTSAVVGIVLALVAIAIVSVLPGDGKPISVGVLAASIAAGVLFGAFTIGLSRTSGAAGMWPAALARLGTAAGLLALALLVTGGVAAPVRTVLRPCLAIGVCETVGLVAFLLALRHGPVSTAAVLFSLYPVTTVLLAMALLGERLSRFQLVGVGLALGAVLLISMS